MPVVKEQCGGNLNTIFEDCSHDKDHVHFSSCSTAVSTCGSEDVEAPDTEKTPSPTDFTFHKSIEKSHRAEIYMATWGRHLEFSSKSSIVAVKRMRKNAISLDLDALAVKVKHPNLVQYFGSWRADPGYFIVMEHCAGKSLFDHLHRSRRSANLTWKQRIKILSDVSAGMRCLHSKSPKIVHGHLASKKILLMTSIKQTSDEPHVKITDFAFVGKQAFCDEGDSPTAKSAGQWRWMAPELFESTEHDEKTDVYSFAMVAYELITGMLPFADRWPDPKMRLAQNPRLGLHIVSGLRPDTKQALQGCPPFLIDLCCQCWNGDASKRPSFEDIVDVLESHEAD